MTPFFLVFLSAYIGEDQDPESYDISLLPQPILAAIEADSYWCLSKLLDGIQDNFTHAQPGIQRQIVKLRELICRIDGKSYPATTTTTVMKLIMSGMYQLESKINAHLTRLPRPILFFVPKLSLN